jgi:hypothetical protein
MQRDDSRCDDLEKELKKVQGEVEVKEYQLLRKFTEVEELVSLRCKSLVDEMSENTKAALQFSCDELRQICEECER